MKAYALLAALALPMTVPAESQARDHCGHYSGGYYGGCAPHYSSYSYGRCYPSYASYGYRPYYAARPYYYGYSPYYSSYPAVSLSFTSAPRTVYRTAPSYDNGSSLEVGVQSALHRRGYYNGELDGDIGPASRSAIRAYQYEHGLDPTGRIDARLLRSLGL